MRYLVTIMLFVLSIIGANAQEKVKIAKTTSVEMKVEGTKHIQAENKPIYVSSEVKENQLEKTVEFYDNYIIAIQTKMDHIKSDEEENKKAIESGWVEEMNQKIAKAKIEREILLKK